MIFSENRFPLFGIMLLVAVRVLAGDEPRQPLRRRSRLGRLARQAGELEEGRQPALEPSWFTGLTRAGSSRLPIDTEMRSLTT